MYNFTVLPNKSLISFILKPSIFNFLVSSELSLWWELEKIREYLPKAPTKAL